MLGVGEDVLNLLQPQAFREAHLLVRMEGVNVDLGDGKQDVDLGDGKQDGDHCPKPRVSLTQPAALRPTASTSRCSTSRSR